jgi:hypothetical protein
MGARGGLTAITGMAAHRAPPVRCCSCGLRVGRSPVDRGKLAMKRSLPVQGNGIPWTGSWPPRTATTPSSWPPRSTNSEKPDRCPTGSPPTSTPATTRGTSQRAEIPRHDGRNRAQGRQSPDPGRAALARRAHQRLAQRLQPPLALLRAQRDRHRRVLRLRRSLPVSHIGDKRAQK